MIFNALKHILGLEFHQGTDIPVTDRQTGRQTHNQTTVCPRLRMHTEA